MEEIKKSSTPVKSWIKKYKSTFVKYNKYIRDNDWAMEYEPQDEFSVQLAITKIVLSRLKYFVTKFDSYRELGYVKDFIELMLKSVTEFERVCEEYIKLNDWTLLSADVISQKKEIKFQADILSDLNKISDTLALLDIDGKTTTLQEMPIYGDKKVPFLMAGMMENKFESIKKFSQAVRTELGYFNSVALENPLSVLDSPEMFINIKNPPKYDNSKHYFEQSADVIQFYENELEKIRKGITIAGVYLSGWLYWHINYFKTEVPMDMFKDTKHYDPYKKILISQPLLRDNEVFVTEMYTEAGVQNLGLLMFGSRRIGKTVLEASLLTYLAVTVPFGEHFVYGGSSGDLDKLAKTLETGFQNVHPAFYLPRNRSDWDDKIEFGLRHNDNTKIPYGHIFINNLNKARTEEEIGAGGTPTGFIVDEVGKFPITKLWMTSLPSFQNPTGWNLTPLLAGCFVAKTKVFDAYGSIVNVEEIRMDTGILGYDTKRNEVSIEPVSHVNPASMKECVTIKTASGVSLTCSYDHPFLVGEEFIEAKDLELGTALSSPYVIENRLKQVENFDYLAKGKGYFSAAKSDLIIEVAKRNYKGHGEQIKRHTMESIDSLEFDPKVSSKARATRISFIEGIMLYFIKNKDEETLLTVRNDSYEETNIIRLVMLSLGVHSKITVGTPNVLELDEYNTAKVVKLVTRYAYTGRIQRFYKGTPLEKDSKTYDAYVTRFEDELLNTPYVYDEIVSIEAVGSKTVYNLTADSTHTYLAEGFITHNTGGNKKLSTEAREMLLNPDAYSLLAMDWDKLNGYVKEEDLVTWERSAFGIFMPAQMSFMEGLTKDRTNLAEWLDIDDEDLKKIEIRVTNWKDSLETIRKVRETKKALPELLKKEKMYYPLNVNESFLTEGNSIFEVDLLVAHEIMLKESGDYGQPFKMVRANGATGVKAVPAPEKEIPKFPWKGGIIDAPVIILEHPVFGVDEKAPPFLYCAGLDSYKTDTSEGSSLGSLVIFKRFLTVNDEYANSVVAVYTTRPNRIDTFNEQIEMILNYYNATLLQENQDISFERYLRRKNLVNKYMVSGTSIAKLFINPNATQMNDIGLNASKKNQLYYFGRIANYVNEVLEVGKDDEGNQLYMIGGARIKDIGLLVELISYRHGGNFDRIISFGHALLLAEYYDEIGRFPKIKTERSTKYKKDLRSRNLYGVPSWKMNTKKNR